MSIDKGAAGKAEVAELVIAGHVVHETDICDVEGGSKEGHDGRLKRSKVVLVGQTQQIQDYLHTQIIICIYSGSIKSGNLLTEWFVTIKNTLCRKFIFC